MRIAIYGTGKACEEFLYEVYVANHIAKAMWKGNANLIPVNKYIEIVYFVETVVSKEMFKERRVVAGDSIRSEDFDILVVASDRFFEIVKGLKQSNPEYDLFAKRIIPSYEMKIDQRGVLSGISQLESKHDYLIREVYRGKIEVVDNKLIIACHENPEDYYYVWCAPSLGDSIVALGLFPEWIKKNKIDKKICLICKKSQEPYGRWFPFISEVIADNELHNMLGDFSRSLRCFYLDNYVFANHGRWDEMGDLDGEWHTMIYLNSVPRYRKLVYDLPEDAPFIPPALKPDLSAGRKHGGGEDVIFFFPDVFSSKIDNIDFWNSLGNRLHELGYKILINTNKSGYQIDGARYIFEDIEETVNVAASCRAVIGARGGIMDILVFTCKPIFNINSDVYWLERWNLSNMTDRDGIYSYLFEDGKEDQLISMIISDLKNSQFQYQL